MRKLQHLFFMLLALGVLAACGEDEPAPIEDEECSKTVFRLQTPSSTPAGAKVFIAGELDKVGMADGEWQQPGTNPDLEMTSKGDGVFEFEFNEIITEGFEFKFFVVPSGVESSWGHGEQSACGTGAPNRTFTADANVEDCTYEFEVEFWEGFCD